MTSLDQTLKMLEEHNHEDPELQKALSRIPQTVDEFEEDYDGEAENLLEDLKPVVGEFIGMGSGQVAEAALALELASRGRNPDELVEIVEKFDEAGLEYEGHEKMGESMSKPVEALGGEDWTRFTYSFDDWMSHEEIEGFSPTVYVNAFRSPAVETGISVNVQSDADLFQNLYGEIVRRNMEDVDLFELDEARDSHQNSTGAHLYFGKLEIPSPFPEVLDGETDYDRDEVMEAMDKYKDTIGQMVEATRRMDEIREECRSRMEDLVDEYVADE